MTDNYSNYDFGFTAVDADELDGGSERLAETQEVASEVASEVSSVIVGKIEDLESKLSSVLVALQNTETEDFTVPNDELARIEGKIDQIVSLETDELAQMFSQQGSDIRAIIDEVEERKAEINEEYKVKIDDIKKLIMPLLYNLMKNPEKEYILWPNRTEVIQQQIAKIEEATK
jgi:hypothetical protein